MPRQPILVDGRSFATKKELTQYMRDLVARTPVDSRIPAEDLAFVSALLERHSEPDRKRGVGIAFFKVVLNPTYGNPCLWLHRTDGSHTDFSWTECITNRPPKRDVTAALRGIVVPQIKAFKEANVGGRCPFRGTFLTLDNSAVDHIAPDTFEALVERFLESQSMQLGDVKVQPSEDNQIVPRLVDPILEAIWFNFHLEHARLRVISAEANLSEAKRGRK